MSIKDNYYVKKIKSSDGKVFIKNNHYTKTCHNGPMCWGLFHNKKDSLLGVCAFATPISENVRKSIWKDRFKDKMKNKTTELHRLFTKDICPKNTETFFISRALKGLKKYKPKYKAVISFADTTENHIGTIYQASNAIYYGMTGENIFFRDQDGALRSPRQNGKNINKKEALNKGWEIEKRKSKHRYLFLLPDPYEKKKQLKSKLSILEKEYPNK